MAAAQASGDVILELDERKPSEFFMKLKWLSSSNEWTNEKTRTKCLLFIGLKQTWLATRLEKALSKQVGEEAPTIAGLQATLESILAPKNVRHTYIDEFEKISLGNRSVFEVREMLESNFRLALPEAESSSVNLMVKRQLVKACPAAWQQRLQEAEFKDVDALCDTIYRLQRVSSEVQVTSKKDVSAGEAVRATVSKPKCNKCGLAGHLAKDCRTRCFKCKQVGHIKAKCTAKTEKPKQASKGDEQQTSSEPSDRARRVELILEDAVLIKSVPEEPEIVVNLLVEGKMQPALVDCGSFYNLITLKTLKLLKAPCEMRETRVRLGAVNKTSLRVLGEVTLSVELGAREASLEFIVTEDLTDSVIIGKQGADLLKIVVWFQARRTQEKASRFGGEV